MADEYSTKRIINLPAESGPAEGDVFVVDNESTGTKKLPITGLIDPTLSQSGQAADAKAVGDALAGKVDAVSGKGLSANDYTDADKAKVDSITEQIATATGVEDLTDGYTSGYIATYKSTIDINDVLAGDTYKHIVVECNPGDIFQLKGHGADNIHALWAWVKSDGTKISYSGSTAVTYEVYTKIVAPAESKYLVSNVYIDTPYGLIKGETTKSIATALTDLNLCIDKDTEPGYLSATGSISAGDHGEKTTDYISVSEGDVINMRSFGDPGTGKLWLGICTYDENKGFLSRAYNKEGTAGATLFGINYTIPEGVSYIRVSARFYDRLMITKGDFDIAYLPASDDIALQRNIDGLGVDTLRAEVDGITGNEILTAQYSSGYVKTSGTTVDITNVISNITYKHIVIECAEGDIFNIIGHGIDNIHALYTFASEDGTILKKAGSATYTDYVAIRAPANAKYLISNVVADEPYSLVRGNFIGNQVQSLANVFSAKTGLLNTLLCPASPKFAMHRGVSKQAPENTVPAFELAGQGGAWGIETDVYETTDGYFILSHDNDVSRMTDGTGKITEMTYAQTQECTIDAGNNIELYPNLKMPLLTEYLGICRRYGCVPFVEIKSVTHYDALVNTIKRAGMEGSAVFLMYYDTAVITTLRTLTGMPILLIGSAVTDVDDLIKKATEYPDLWLTLYSTTVTNDVINSAHDVNVPVGVWTIENQSSADQLFSDGLDYITSNSITKMT